MPFLIREGCKGVETLTNGMRAYVLWVLGIGLSGTYFHQHLSRYVPTEVRSETGLGGSLGLAGLEYDQGCVLRNVGLGLSVGVQDAGLSSWRLTRAVE